MGNEDEGVNVRNVDDSGTGTVAVSVSRRIEAPAAAIFAILADPSRHPGVDGTGMLQEGGPSSVIAGAGDVFVMKMHFAALGDYEMINYVVEFEENRRIAWEPGPGRGHPAAEAVPTGNRPGHRWSFELTPDGDDATIVKESYDCSDAPEELQSAVDGGRRWLDGMTETLARLDELVATAAMGKESGR
jgi:uncharacterized protein YndB with AHSA1/START domain